MSPVLPILIKMFNLLLFPDWAKQWVIFLSACTSSLWSMHSSKKNHVTASFAELQICCNFCWIICYWTDANKLNQSYLSNLSLYSLSYAERCKVFEFQSPRDCARRQHSSFRNVAAMASRSQRGVRFDQP